MPFYGPINFITKAIVHKKQLVILRMYNSPEINRYGILKMYQTYPFPAGSMRTLFE